jgi:hypothetical protein
MDFSVQRFLFAHALQPFVVEDAWGGRLSLFVGCPTGQSVIEEKGEGFENGKNPVGSFG